MDWYKLLVSLNAESDVLVETSFICFPCGFRYSLGFVLLHSVGIQLRTTLQVQDMEERGSIILYFCRYSNNNNVNTAVLIV